VHFIIINAGKHDQDEQSLVQEIQQLGLPKENAEALGRQYREHKDILRAALAEESYRMNKYLSTDWRVDCILASSTSSPTPNTIILPSSQENHDYAVSKPDTGVALHLNILYDSRPQDGPMESSLISNPVDRVKNVAFEVSPEKLDLLIHELSIAVKSLDSIEG
jgi:plasmid stability protein